MPWPLPVATRHVGRPMRARPPPVAPEGQEDQRIDHRASTYERVKVKVLLTPPIYQRSGTAPLTVHIIIMNIRFSISSIRIRTKLSISIRW
jgi:hypothetical protein